MNEKELAILREMVERYQKEVTPNRHSLEWIEARLQELLEQKERDEETAELTEEDRIDCLETEALRLHNLIITLQNRINEMEQESVNRETGQPEKGAASERTTRMHGFLVGVALAWIIVALGVFGLLMGWQVLNWSADFLGMSVPVLLSLFLLILLGFLLEKRARAVVEWLLNYLDSDKEEVL